MDESITDLNIIQQRLNQDINDIFTGKDLTELSNILGNILQFDIKLNNKNIKLVETYINLNSSLSSAFDTERQNILVSMRQCREDLKEVDRMYKTVSVFFDLKESRQIMVDLHDKINSMISVNNEKFDTAYLKSLYNWDDLIDTDMFKLVDILRKRVFEGVYSSTIMHIGHSRIQDGKQVMDYIPQRVGVFNGGMTLDDLKEYNSQILNDFTNEDILNTTRLLKNCNQNRLIIGEYLEKVKINQAVIYNFLCSLLLNIKPLLRRWDGDFNDLLNTNGDKEKDILISYFSSPDGGFIRSFNTRVASLNISTRTIINYIIGLGEYTLLSVDVIMTQIISYISKNDFNRGTRYSRDNYLNYRGNDRPYISSGSELNVITPLQVVAPQPFPQ